MSDSESSANKTNPKTCNATPVISANLTTPATLTIRP